MQPKYSLSLKFKRRLVLFVCMLLHSRLETKIKFLLTIFDKLLA